MQGLELGEFPKSSTGLGRHGGASEKTVDIVEDPPIHLSVCIVRMQTFGEKTLQV